MLFIVIDFHYVSNCFPNLLHIKKLNKIEEFRNKVCIFLEKSISDLSRIFDFFYLTD